MKRVEIESPYAGEVSRNLIYARRAMADSLKRDEAPLASHLLYTQEGILDDEIPEERQLGMEAGKVWSKQAELVVFYTDYGWSKGMLWGKEQAEKAGIPTEERQIGQNPDDNSVTGT